MTLRKRTYDFETRTADIIRIKTDEEDKCAIVELYLHGGREKPTFWGIKVKEFPKDINVILKHVRKYWKVGKISPQAKSWKWGKNKMTYETPVS